VADDPLGGVYAFVERAYVRMQASDLLTQCLEDGKAAPLHKLVQSLVLAGPQSLGALREVMEELSARSDQIKEDRRQVYIKLEGDLKSYGVRLGGRLTASSLARLTPVAFLALLREQKVQDEEAQLACLQLLQDSLGVMDTLVKHEALLEEMGFYLEDWLWGLIYQSARDEHFEGGGGSPKERLM
jgi:hypothetical protein